MKILIVEDERRLGQFIAKALIEQNHQVRVVATCAAARDALALVEVEYEPLPPVTDARRALEPDAPLVRDDRLGGPVGVPRGPESGGRKDQQSEPQ